MRAFGPDACKCIHANHGLHRALAYRRVSCLTLPYNSYFRSCLEKNKKLKHFLYEYIILVKVRCRALARASQAFTDLKEIFHCRVAEMLILINVRGWLRRSKTPGILFFALPTGVILGVFRIHTVHHYHQFYPCSLVPTNGLLLK